MSQMPVVFMAGSRTPREVHRHYAARANAVNHIAQCFGACVGWPALRASVELPWVPSPRTSTPAVVPIAVPRAPAVTWAAWATARACWARGQGQGRWFRTKKQLFAVGGGVDPA